MATLFDFIHIADERGLRMSVEFAESPVLFSIRYGWVTGRLKGGPATVRLEGEARNMADFLECLEAFAQECRDAMAKGGFGR
ncbi:hypothetical protein AAY81_00830 [Denitrobacterium detoxificans]|uniref:Uncharacterized protein n=1 Tax=Denitrobacterium detoxificans TaxID=79604 RepID=A0A172RW47_9ACTN|nr:hypothetical protein [Denitrobacterium detoxificans]ANE21950.1 hypothetical protein AAY81_00830 [Denitrobacterium detoxificans]SEP04525.1 hypothetical protein SAMN02910314_02010 [Denitrobacterium detoxificans]